MAFFRRCSCVLGWVILAAGMPCGAAPAPTTAMGTGGGAPVHWQFSFGADDGAAPAGYTPVGPDTLYSAAQGYGFEPNVNVPAPGVAPMPTTAPAIQAVARGGNDPLQAGLVTSNQRFLFSVAVPAGNYRVTVTLGDASAPSTTTVKAEARRLMLEQVHTEAGAFVTKSFLVNVRRPEIAGGAPGAAQVSLDPREPGSFTWDDKLSLEFCGERPALVALRIDKVDDAVTVFLCGDSTVTDQPREPYGMWGQMLPRFFNDKVAVANYAESGETLKAFGFEHRWAKVMSEVKPGDYVFLQFGHNDLNKSGRNAMWPADQPSGNWANTYSPAETDYKRLLKAYAAQVKARGATPVIVSPMTKIDLRTGAINTAGLRDYPQAAVEAAHEAGVALIDLNAMSVEVMKALGPEVDRQAYVDGLHTRSYGGYLLARCIVEGIRADKLGLAGDIAADAGTFDPAHPEPLPADFKLPLEPAPSFGRGRRGRGGGGFGRRGVGGGRGAPATRGN